MNFSSFYKQALFGGLAFAIILGIGSCGTDNDSVRPASTQDNEKQKMLKQLPEIIKALPKFKVVSESDKSNSKGDKNEGFSFSNSTDGFDFANPSGNTYSSDEGYIIVTTPGFGSNSGGVVTAGNNTYNIDLTFCLAASGDDNDDDAEEIVEFTGFGSEGLSFVLGISGEFDIETAEDDLGFDAMVLYAVFDDEAQGSYDVINFFESFGDLDDEPDFGELAYAIIWDFQNGLIYISSDGNLNVNGGDITFSGEYLEIEIDAEDFLDIEEIDDFKFVNGAGTLGC